MLPDSGGSSRSQATGACAVARSPADSIRDRAAARDVVRQVLPDDRVEHDGREARSRLGELLIEPVEQIGARDRRVDRTGDDERGLQHVEAVGLAGPHVRQQREPSVGRRRVDGVTVTPEPFGDDEGDVEGGHPVGPHVDEAHRRTSRPEGQAVLLVAVLVEAEVQARARAELEHAQREAGVARDDEEPADQRGRAEHLVGLHRMGERVAHLGWLRRDEVEERRPHRAGIAVAAEGRVVPREVRCPALEDDPVDATEQAQLVDAFERLGRERLQHVEHRTTGARIGGHPLAQHPVELRPEGAAPDRLDVEPPSDRLAGPGGRCGPGPAHSGGPQGRRAGPAATGIGAPSTAATISQYQSGQSTTPSTPTSSWTNQPLATEPRRRRLDERAARRWPALPRRERHARRADEPLVRSSPRSRTGRGARARRP